MHQAEEEKTVAELCWINSESIVSASWRLPKSDFQGVSRFVSCWAIFLVSKSHVNWAIGAYSDVFKRSWGI